MNWDAVGAIGEVVAATTVIATLVYLSVQIRQATRENRLPAIHEISASYTDWNQSIAPSQDLSRIWDAALRTMRLLKENAGLDSF